MSWEDKLSETGAVDIIFRLVDGYGVLPIVTVGDEEIYRGEFEKNVANALERIDRNFPDLRSSPIFKKGL